MQQQDAATFFVEPEHCPLHDLLGTDVAPVVGDHVRAPGHQRLLGEIVFHRLRAAKARNAEEGRQRFRVAERGVDRRNAAVDFACDALQGQMLEDQRMVVAMRPDGVALVVHAPDHRGIIARHLADQEVGDLHALRGQRIENDVAIGRQRAVVEGDHHLMVVERQRLLVLHGADAAELARVDGEDAAGAERLRMARALRRHGRPQSCGQQKTNPRDKTHNAPPAPTFAPSTPRIARLV